VLTTEDSQLSFEQPEALRGARIPVVNSRRWFRSYITLLVNHPDLATLLPTEFEMDIIISTHAARLVWLYHHTPESPTAWVLRMREKESFDQDPALTGLGLMKYSTGGWAYRMSTWEHGPRPLRHDSPLTIHEVLDRAWSGILNLRWETWKETHPELFGPQAYERTRAELDHAGAKGQTDG
jgi:hypothetical protein